MVKPLAFPLVCRISSVPPKMQGQFYPVKPMSFLSGSSSVLRSNEQILGRLICLGPRNCLKSLILNCPVMGVRGLSSFHSQKNGERGEKRLPWLAASANRGRKKVESKVNNGARSSWEESAAKFLNGGASAVETEEKERKFERRREFSRKADDNIENEEEEGDVEVVNDPRWDDIRNRFNRFDEVKLVSDRPEVRRWNKQENWGKKVWKEAKESSAPKFVGEGIYGVGPVLAALSAGRREFYKLYVQEGLELSSNNRKKKDKKGFEKVLKMADKIEISIKEVPKHDLNMIVDNRPHQGLVLDASPLEMVGIKELEPISCEGEMGPLWLALDEIMDPQNLGAIVRSAYFFGAAGVVLCSKNSAPLSGVVSKASAGALELMELRSCKNMMQFLTSSAENGWRVLGGSVSSRAISLSEAVPGAPTILVLGNEGTGLRPLVERSCTQLIKIPGNSPVDMVTMGDEDGVSFDKTGQEFRSFLAVESLNVSVAAGVMLNHLIGSNYHESMRVQESESS